jgi:hypothetical protein
MVGELLSVEHGAWDKQKLTQVFYGQDVMDKLRTMDIVHSTTIVSQCPCVLVLSW